jgi:hypothetical protein
VRRRAKGLSVVFMLLAFFATAATASGDTPPTVTMDAPSSVGYTTAHVSGTVDPEGGPSEAYIWFEFSRVADDPPSWQQAGFTSLQGPAAEGTDPVPVEADLTGLKAGVEYQVRLVAVNDAWNNRSETPPATFTTQGTTPPTVTLAPASEVGATTAHVSGTVNPSGTDPAWDVEWRFECTPACPGTYSGEIDADTSDHTVEADLVGLEPNTSYEVRLIASNSGEEASAGPQPFTTDGALPTVRTVPAYAPVGATQSLLGGEVDPQNAATEYWFEYGTDATYGQSMPVTEDGDAGASGQPVFVTESLAGLTAGTEYHFRLSARNAEGTAHGHDLTFQVRNSPPASPCPNEGNRVGIAAELPDCRAYEQVSPPDKGGWGVWTNSAVASASGDKLAWLSRGSFAGQPTALALMLSNYLSRRTAGSWLTEGISSPTTRVSSQAGFYGFSDDLEKAYFSVKEYEPETLTPGVESANENFYLRDNLTGSAQFLATAARLNNLSGRYESGNFGGASADFKQILFNSNNASGLTPDTPCKGPDYAFCAYEWDEGELRLLSVLPDGQPTIGTVGGKYIGNAISEDGRRAFFTAPEVGNGRVYMRENGTTTINVAASERTSSGGASGGPVEYLGAEAAHGGRVLFMTANSLVDTDTDETQDLYIYEAARPAGEHLTLLSPDESEEPPSGAAVLGVLARSSDLQRVWFVAQNQILPGEVVHPTPKLFLWDNTGAAPKISYLGALDESDSSDWDAVTVGAYENKPVRVSANDRYMVFRSRSRLTAFDNENKEEIYLYDAQSGGLECATCAAGDMPPGYLRFDSGTAQFSIKPNTHELRNVSDDGRVFFETDRSLVKRDSNGRGDVYEYESGSIRLISSGLGSADSSFLDASENGDHVFFITGDRLVGWDGDNYLDAYDAAVGGGFPEPPPEAAPCEGEACLPAAARANDHGAEGPASSTYSGPGDQVHHRKRHRHKHPRRRHRKHHRGKHREQPGQQHGAKSATRKDG